MPESEDHSDFFSLCAKSRETLMAFVRQTQTNESLTTDQDMQLQKFVVDFPSSNYSSEHQLRRILGQLRVQCIDTGLTRKRPHSSQGESQEHEEAFVRVGNQPANASRGTS